MKPMIVMALLGLCASPLLAQDGPQRGKVDVVFCVDRSGSMERVIETAKRKIWTIVNEVAQQKPTPVLRIGLIGYGSADKDIKFFPLSTDLDKVYENLTTFRCDMGGDEWVGWALLQAVERMEWSTERRSLKMIFMVGNETAMQGTEANFYTKTAPQALKKDITVNAIYCGKPNPEEEKTWRELAALSDGMYSQIDLSGGEVTIQTPQDKVLVELNQKLNKTYLPFGRHGAEGKDKLEEADRKTAGAGAAPSVAARAAAKASAVYNNAAWDLVDASKEEKFDLKSVKTEDLPKEMQSMTPEERKAHIEKALKEREAIQKEIAKVSAERAKVIDAEMKKQNLSADASFDQAVRRTIQEQAAKQLNK
ncbi:MAG: VWA domain-containing protein [Planctomycetaceae bacterium]|nr:VWA domain-containing protein [Planctomycetaceae bacterium]